MALTSNFNDYRPLTWFRRTPIYITTIIAALYVVGMFATTILSSARIDPTPLAFSAPTFFHGALWQPFTCTFIQEPSFFFLFNVLFFYWAGLEVEKYLGQRRYLQFFGLLLLLPPIIMCLWSAVGVNGFYRGNYELSIGMFIAFATLYPNVEWFGWVTLKWLAFAGLVLASMQYLPQHNWVYLSVLWVLCGAAFGFIRFLQRGGSGEFASAVGKLVRRKPAFRVVRREENPSATIDPLLEKISREGLKSLTAAERDRLERARAELLKKGA